MVTLSALDTTSTNLRAVLDAVGVLGTLASLIALALTILWSPRRSNEEPSDGHRLHAIRFWRPSHYSQALGRLDDLCNALSEGAYHPRDERGFVTREDLTGWITKAALTCAANIIPQSLGKANLFRISEVERDAQKKIVSVRVYSSDFDGIFPLSQLVDLVDPHRLRDLSVHREGQSPRDYPAALQCVLLKRPIIQSIKRRSSELDEPERLLGVTHVLGIPVTADLSASKSDDPVSITVDLRFSWPIAWLVDQLGLRRRTLLRRASRIAKILGEHRALTSSAYLPPANLTPPTDAPTGEIDLRGRELGLGTSGGGPDHPSSFIG
jgi:hypothetical protein